MTCVLLYHGATADSEVEKLCQKYQKLLAKYVPVEEKVLPSPKKAAKMTPAGLKSAEWEQLQSFLKPGDSLILLDERGQRWASRPFAEQLQRWLNAGPRRLIFAVGGPHGFAPQAVARAQASWSLSPLTTTHQLIRIFLAEQLYRAFSILHGDPYHND
jgi:23S rRNA (pseudouridine1915-N3)-methyltransferase